MFHDMEVLGPGPKDLIITTLVCPVVMVNVYSRMVGDVTTVHPVHCVWCVIQKSTFWNSAWVERIFDSGSSEFPHC